MSSERETGENFLARWSRMKTVPAPAAESAPAVPSVAPPVKEDELPHLPSIDELTMDSDFRGFLHPKVDEGVRRAALRKLFTDPHFNVMDGLDVYIDDYSKADPIPPEMLAGLKQAQRIIRWAEGKEDEIDGAAELADVNGEQAALAASPETAPVDGVNIDQALPVHEVEPNNNPA